MEKYYLQLYWGENFCQKPLFIKKGLKKIALKCLDIINQYPGIIQDELINSLADWQTIKKNQIIIGNGIENLIHLVAKSYIDKDSKVSILSPSFDVYEKAVINYGGHIKKIHVKINQSFTGAEMLEKIKNTNIFFLAYPNNPTGQYVLSLKEIKRVLINYRGILVADECYFGIGKKTTISLIKKYHNLIVLRSFSKNLGLAGLRIGFAISNKNNIAYLKKYSKEIEGDQINIFSCLITKYILDHTENIINKYLDFKKQFIKEIVSKIKHIKVIPTNTSFILIEIDKKITSGSITKELKHYKIVIKDTTCYEGFPSNILMFAVPQKTAWDYFIKTLKYVLNN